jgi:salicylate 5-hydroxylase large subunit
MSTLPRTPTRGIARPEAPWTRIAFDWYSDPEIYAREQATIFRGRSWSYAALSAELPTVGAYKTTTIGDASIILVRGKGGEIGAFENRCAHKGVQLCYKTRGTTKSFQCPYHQWTYDLEGKLIGVPFRKGIAELGGGMPADFDLTKFPLTRLRAHERNGVVFVTFDATTESFEDYLGQNMLEYFDRIFDGRGLRVLGYQRQRIESNWKLEMENLKDPYHASLLHIFFATFGLFRLDQPAWVEMDAHGRHAIMAIAKRGDRAVTDATKEMSSFRSDLVLQGPQLIQPVPEFPSRAIGVMQTLWPNLIIQQQSNTLATRQIICRGPGAFELHWTYFGYDDDDAEMTGRRLRQANLVGTSGFVSIDDAEVLEMQQHAIAQYPAAEGIVEMGGLGTEDQPHHVTEVPVRAFWRYYREVMGL